jgi:hypothetical protein
MVSTKKMITLYTVFSQNFLKKKKKKMQTCNQRKRRNQDLIYIAAYDYT